MVRKEFKTGALSYHWNAAALLLRWFNYAGLHSEVQACIKGSIDSIKNPRCGRIQADAIQEIILDSERMNPDQTQIIIPAKSHI